MPSPLRASTLAIEVLRGGDNDLEVSDHHFLSFTLLSSGRIIYCTVRHYTQYGPITNGVIRARGGAARPAAVRYRTILRVGFKLGKHHKECLKVT